MTSITDQEQKRQRVLDTLIPLFAPEDEALQQALLAAQQEGLPDIQIGPLQGKLLQVLAVACQARKILEIGALAGYSGIWLARALPVDGRLISLEIDPKHAEVVRRSFARAGVADRTEVRVGRALDLLPQMAGEGPFDLVFIDADRASFPDYYRWALRLSRAGSIIVVDNCLAGGSELRYQDQGQAYGAEHYPRQLLEDSDTISIALPLSQGYTDGFLITVVRH